MVPVRGRNRMGRHHGSDLSEVGTALLMIRQRTRPDPYMVKGVNTQIRARIRLAVAAYTYEFLNQSVMSDAEFDALSRTVDLSYNTGHEVLDRFFREEFHPDTGQWIHKHPELEKVQRVAKKVLAKN